MTTPPSLKTQDGRVSMPAMPAGLTARPLPVLDVQRWVVPGSNLVRRRLQQAFGPLGGPLGNKERETELPMKIPIKDASWLGTYNGKWVVADLNQILALPSSFDLPAGIVLVIPEQLFAEAATGEVGTKSDPVRRFAKIESVLQTPCLLGRVIVARDWHLLSNEERSPKTIDTSAHRIADAMSTQFVAEVQVGNARFVWDAKTKDIIAREDWHQEFTKIVDEFSNQVMARPKELRELLEKRREEGIAEMFAGPDLRFANRMDFFPRRMARMKWKEELDNFPDRAAIARWQRILLYFALLRVTKREQGGYANNLDDAHYIFASLYTRHLWTNDRGMERAAQVVSAGNVRVYRALEELA